MSDTPQTAPDQGRGSPTSGCFILGMIVTVFGGLVILYTTVFFLQSRAISGFTESEPVSIPPIEPTEAQIRAVRDKLSAIRTATSEDRKERILLTADDLNTLIATADLLEDFRGSTRIEEITARGIVTRMTQPMRKFPLSPSQRHLNAVFLFEPELRRRTVALRVLDITSNKGTVPRQFIENYDSIGFFRLDPENPVIQPFVPKLDRVYTEDGHVVIETGRPPEP